MTMAPTLRLNAVHVRELRGLRKLDLPEDGMGWGAEIPSLSVIGGANGSGKTTFLRCLAHAARLLVA